MKIYMLYAFIGTLILPSLTVGKWMLWNNKCLILVYFFTIFAIIVGARITYSVRPRGTFEPEIRKWLVASLSKNIGCEDPYDQ